MCKLSTVLLKSFHIYPLSFHRPIGLSPVSNAFRQRSLTKPQVIGERVKRLRRPDRTPDSQRHSSPTHMHKKRMTESSGEPGVSEAGPDTSAANQTHVEELTREVALLRSSLERAQSQLEQVFGLALTRFFSRKPRR